MKNALIYIILIIAASLVAGCNLLGSKQSNLSSPFPLTPGSTWTYAAYDSTISPPSQDTIRISILQTDTTSGRIHSLWTYQFYVLTDSSFILPNGVGVVYPSVVLRVLITDSIAVSFSSNTLRFTFPQSQTLTNISYPLEIGKKWTDNNSSYTVISIDTVSWSGGTFHEGYQVVQKINIHSTSGTISGTITYWIEPDVGIIKAYYREVVGNREVSSIDNTKWMLLSYKIN